MDAWALHGAQHPACSSAHSHTHLPPSPLLRPQPRRLHQARSAGGGATSTAGTAGRQAPCCARSAAGPCSPLQPTIAPPVRWNCSQSACTSSPSSEQLPAPGCRGWAAAQGGGRGAAGGVSRGSVPRALSAAQSAHQVQSAPQASSSAYEDAQEEAAVQYAVNIMKTWKVTRLRDELYARGASCRGQALELQTRLSEVMGRAGLAALGRQLAAEAASRLAGSSQGVAAAGESGDEGGTDSAAEGGREGDQGSGVLVPPGSERFREALLSNQTLLQVSFLGTACAEPTRHRSPSSLVVRPGAAVWLVDCGEDTQRQLSAQPALRHGRLSRIFLTARAPECLLGLPGMLCTVSASRERGHEAADIPLHIYGPPGTADYAATMLALSDTYLEMPVAIFELVAGPVPPQRTELRCINERARIWQAEVPPDQLNPLGFLDAELVPILQRAAKRRGPRYDPRAATIDIPLPPPGDPARRDVALRDMTWTLRCEREWVVTAVPLRSQAPTFGFVIQEADRRGKLDVERALAVGLQPGRAFQLLKDGAAVTNPSGQTITPEMVIGATRKGRKVALLGDCVDPSTAAAAARGAELAVCAARAGEADGHPEVGRTCCTAAAAGAFARQARAQHLLLTRYSAAYLPPGAWPAARSESPADDDAAMGPAPRSVAGNGAHAEGGLRSAGELVREAQQAFGCDSVEAAYDHYVAVLERHEPPLAPPPPLLGDAAGQLVPV